MTSKRIPLSERRNLDRRGVDLILGGGEPAAAAEDVMEAVPLRPGPARIEKVTLYIRPDQVEAIEEIQLNERKRTGKKPDKSDLVQEALDLLIEKYSKTA